MLLGFPEYCKLVFVFRSIFEHVEIFLQKHFCAALYVLKTGKIQLVEILLGDSKLHINTAEYAWDSKRRTEDRYTS